MAEIAVIEKSKENEDLLAKAQQGDMIEFVRGHYSHWAIYAGQSVRSCLSISHKNCHFILGNGLVIHRWGDNDGIGKSIGFWGNLLTFSGTQFDKATILQS